jgi:hypothetical protein
MLMFASNPELTIRVLILRTRRGEPGLLKRAFWDVQDIHQIKKYI